MLNLLNMNIYEDISIKPFNTFGIDVRVAKLVDCTRLHEVTEISQMTAKSKAYVLGGGSNVLFLSDYDGTIIRPLVTGIEVVDETSTHVDVMVGAGVEWDAFVKFCVEREWQGVENLSGIPGNVGASPVQNIGAYGAEASDVIIGVDGVLRGSSKYFRVTANECKFGYRDSIFKRELRNSAIITRVLFRLAKEGTNFNLDYGPVRERVKKLGEPSLQNIRRAIIDIRNEKLPNPSETGNAGSFFKNPEVDAGVAQTLQRKFPNIPLYILPDGRYKIPAGWLIEQCGWKGKEIGHAAVHDKQALVLVNKGEATGMEILMLANSILDDVRLKFGIDLQFEVNIIE